MSLLMEGKAEEKFYLLNLYQLRVYKLLNIQSHINIETAEADLVDAISVFRSGRS